MNPTRLLIAAFIMSFIEETALAQVDTVRASVDSSGTEGNDSSGADWNDYESGVVISADGRVVAFASRASNLVVGDTNGVWDIFVHELQTGLTERISVDSSGTESNDESSLPGISADGSVVTFQSWATNLVSSDSNGTVDVFVHDRSTGLTDLVDVDSLGAQGTFGAFSPSISADGRVVAFASASPNLVAGDGNSATDAFVHDRSTGTTERVSVDSFGVEANGASVFPSVSSDGATVSFCSYATNLVPGDSNGFTDVFARNRSSGITELISVDSAGAQGNGNSGWSSPSALSSDGEVIAFASDATNLVHGDTNKRRDIFVRDRQGGTTERVSINSAGVEGNSSSEFSAVPADGEEIAFESLSSNLVIGDTNGCADIFVFDRASRITKRVSLESSGAEASSSSQFASITADGILVAFANPGSDLVSGDANGSWDVFVRGCMTDASWSNYGMGFPGTNGVPAFTSRSNPVFGTTVTLDVENSYGNSTFGLLFVGFQRTSIHSNWGGDLLVIPAITIPITFSFGNDSFTGHIRNDPQLCGFEIDLQAVEADPGAAKGVSFTAGLALVVGR